MNEWKIKIIDPIDYFGQNIIIYRRSPQGGTEVYNPIDRTVVKRNEGEINPISSTLHLDHEMLESLLEALLKIGVKPKDQIFIEGKYDSQTKHLEDLRQLLKLK